MSIKTNLNWIEFYIGLALAIGKKSKDSTTHGCVITSASNRPLGIGFNGYPEGFPDDEMPTNRDGAINKYLMTPHAEVNAVSNCEHKPIGATAYVDGHCCAPCLIHLYQNGIRKVYCLDRTSKMLNDDTQKQVDFVIEKSKKSKCGALEVFIVKPNISWLVKLGKEVEENYSD